MYVAGCAVRHEHGAQPASRVVDVELPIDGSILDTPDDELYECLLDGPVQHGLRVGGKLIDDVEQLIPRVG